MRALLLLLVLAATVVKAAVPPPPTTPYTRGLLVTTNAPEARAYLGVGSSVTNNIIVVTNLTVIETNIYNVSKGGHLTVSNSLEVLPLKSNLLAVTSSGLVTQANYGTGISWDPSTLTVSASAAPPVFTLISQSGTNADTIDFSGKPNNSAWHITLTNNAFFGTPSNIPTNPYTFYIWTRQPSTGTCFVTFTNGTYGFSGGSTSAPVAFTNSGTIEVWTFMSEPFSNKFMGVLTPDLRR